MSNQQKVPHIIPLLEVVNMSQNMILKPSKNLLKRRIELSEDQLIEVPGMLLSLTSFNPKPLKELEHYRIQYNENEKIIEKQVRYFEAWANTIIREVNTIYDLVTNSKETTLEFTLPCDSSLTDFLYLYINEVLSDAEIKRRVKVLMNNPTPFSYIKDFSVLDKSNYKASTLYNQPVSYFIKKMKQKDKEILEPIRHTWAALFESYCYLSNSSLQSYKNVKPHVLRKELMKNHFTPPNNPDEKSGKKLVITLKLEEYMRKMVQSKVVDGVDTLELYGNITLQTVKKDWDDLTSIDQ